MKAFDEIFRIASKGGMIELWALEQKPSKKVKENVKDQIITWTIRPTMEIVERYYHLFDKKEVEDIVLKLRLKYNFNYRIYFDTDNWIIEFNKY
jgi:putative component of toxin-antitoxin plasmid stabilization module